MHSGTLHHIMLSIFHIFLVSPFLIYVGLTRNTMSNTMFNTILGIGLIVLIYHSFKIIYKWNSRQYHSLWINLIHIFIIAPVLLYIGYMKEYSIKPIYEIVLMLGFASLGYHLYSLVVYLQMVDHNTGLIL